MFEIFQSYHDASISDSFAGQKFELLEFAAKTLLTWKIIILC